MASSAASNVKRSKPLDTQEVCCIRRKKDVENTVVGNNHLLVHRERVLKWRPEGRRSLNHKNDIVAIEVVCKKNLADNSREV